MTSNAPFSRRRFLALSTLGPAGLSAAPIALAADAKPSKLLVNCSGGVMGKAVEDAYGKVFTDRTGIAVQITSPPDLGKLRAMVESRNVEWDVTELNSADARLAGKMGLLEPIDGSIVNRASYPADARDTYALTSSVYSTMLAYRSDVFKSGGPRTWADFWDVARFPGARALWNSPIDNLEFALLADGVKPTELYPLDIERGFRKLDQIRKHVTVWWTSGAQQTQLIVDKEVVMTSAWNGRMYNAIKQGAPIAIEWRGAVIKQAYFGIPKGAKNAAWSQQFLAAMIDPKAQSVFANQFVSPGLNPEAARFTDAAVKPYLPTTPENLASAFWQDDAWWNEHVAELKTRWQRWMLG